MAKGDTWQCKRCGGEWVQRSAHAVPIRCGKRGCQSSYWNLSRAEGRDSQEPELPDPPDDDDPKETDPLMVEGQR